MKNKFYTVLNGIIGTAHYNRHNELVDFRPVSKVEVEVDYTFLIPPKGQESFTELTPDTSLFKKKGMKVPNVVITSRLGNGSSPNEVITEVGCTINGIEIIIPTERMGITTTESLALHQEWLEANKVAKEIAKKERKAQREAKQLAQVESAKNFELSLPDLYASFKGQERKWVRKFIKDHNKAQAEVESLFIKINLQGYRDYLNNLGVEFSWQRPSALSKRLGEVLNIK